MSGTKKKKKKNITQTVDDYIVMLQHLHVCEKNFIYISSSINLLSIALSD